MSRSNGDADRSARVRGSRQLARAWMCRPAARPMMATSAASGTRAMSPIRSMPLACSFAAVFGPTPHIRSTASGWRNSSSRSGGTTRRPSGLATPLATFARNFVRATPTVIGRPTRSTTSTFSLAAISTGAPAIRRSPPTSRKASSIDSPSTNGVVSRNTSNTALLASEYASMRGDTTTRSGHSRRASPPPIAPRTPYAHAPRNWR